MAVSVRAIKKAARQKKWIQSAIKRPGALHRQLGIPEGKKIPREKLLEIKRRLTAKAKKGKLSPSELRLLRRVNLALTLRKF